SAREFPAATFDPVQAERMLRRPHNPVSFAARAGVALLHNLRPPAPDAAERPQANVPASSARWYLLGNLDSAAASTAADSAAASRKRDPKAYRELSRRAAHNYRHLIQEWPRLQEIYRAAIPELTSVESWRKVFES